MLKKIFFDDKIKVKIKTTGPTGLKNELKYSLMTDGNTCIAEVYLKNNSVKD